jgi:hypothetical protein
MLLLCKAPAHLAACHTHASEVIATCRSKEQRHGNELPIHMLLALHAANRL